MKRLSESRCQDVTFTAVIAAGLKHKHDEMVFWASDIQSIFSTCRSRMCYKLSVFKETIKTRLYIITGVGEGTLTDPNDGHMFNV